MMNVRRRASPHTLAAQARAACRPNRPADPTGTSGPQPAVGGAAVRAGPIDIRLELPQAVMSGRPVPLRVVARNVGERPAHFNVSEPQTVNFVVLGADGRVVWSLFGDEPLVQDPVLAPPLAPGAERVFTHTWDQRDNQGRRVPPGQYSVGAVLYAEVGAQRLGPVALAIRSP